MLAGAATVVLAVPSQSLRENLSGWAPLVGDDALLVSLMKGVELGTHLRMSEVISEVAGVPADRVAVVSGPNLAKEIAARQPTATVVACTDHDRAERLAHDCSTPYFRPYTQDDVVGVELGGAVKNVIALAVGMAEGLGMGDNTRASIITRGLAETARLAAALGADPTTISGLAGMGDLVATCASPLSRNRTFGHNLGQGMSVEEVVALTRQTAEGVKSCRSIVELAQSAGVDMPITQAVVAVVHEGVRRRRDGAARAVARPQARADLSVGTARRQGSRSSARSRSAQRSSTSSMPTDSRTRSSGTVAGSLPCRRRRSSIDSTPPRLVAGTHSRTASTSASAAASPPRTCSGEDRAVAAHLGRREGVPRVVRQAGVTHPLDGRVGGQPAGELGGGGLRPLHPQGHRAQAAQGEPRLERAGDRAVHAPVGAQPLGDDRVARDRRAEQHVGVAGQVLGDRVHDHVGAEVERALHERGGEGVVDHAQHAGVAGGGQAGAQVAHLQQRVGRRLQPQHVGARRGRTAWPARRRCR